MVYKFIVFSALTVINKCLCENEKGYISLGTVLLGYDVDIYIVWQILLSSIDYFSQTLFFFNFPWENINNQILITQLCAVDCCNSKENKEHLQPSESQHVWLLCTEQSGSLPKGTEPMQTHRSKHCWSTTSQHLPATVEYLLALEWFIQNEMVKTYINTNCFQCICDFLMNYMF